MMRTAMRSFTELAGFMYSTFAKTRHAAPSVTLLSRTRGVLPMAATAVAVAPSCPNRAYAPACFGSRSFAYTTWHAVQPEER